jgi:hypothetical protein
VQAWERVQVLEPVQALRQAWERVPVRLLELRA